MNVAHMGVLKSYAFVIGRKPEEPAVASLELQAPSVSPVTGKRNGELK
jgi:hypothetical protein